MDIAVRKLVLQYHLKDAITYYPGDPQGQDISMRLILGCPCYKW